MPGPENNREDKTYPEMDHSDYRKLYKELLTEDREYYVVKFSDIIDEKLETKKILVQRVDRHSKILSWLIISNVLQGATILGIVIYLLNLHK